VGERIVIKKLKRGGLGFRIASGQANKKTGVQWGEGKRASKVPSKEWILRDQAQVENSRG